jgi:hypothetical protein
LQIDFLRINPEFADYHREFEKPDRNEVMVFSRGNFIVDGNTFNLRIQAITDDNSIRPLWYWNSCGSEFQYSRVPYQNTAILLLPTQDQNCSIFKIDSQTGYIDYITDVLNVNGLMKSDNNLRVDDDNEKKIRMDTNLKMMTDEKLQYLLYLPYEDQKHKSNASPFQPLFVLVNLQELQVVGTVTWAISHKKLGDQIYIFRSERPGYDFSLEYVADGKVFAVAYYCISSDDFFSDYDFTGGEKGPVFNVERKTQRELGL